MKCSSVLSRHGKSRTPIHNLWCDMRKRCNNPNQKFYHRYGGRGIKVCKRWMKFENFYEDMGDVPDGKTLDRINNDGNYSPENCRWATQKEQMNNKSTNRIIKFNGVSKTMSEWSAELGIGVGTIWWRIKNNLPIEKIFFKGRLKSSFPLTKKGLRLLKYKGQIKTMSEWARDKNIQVGTLWSRLKKGWSINEALS